MKEGLQGRLAGGKQTSLDSSSVTYGGDSDCVECCCPHRTVWKSSYDMFSCQQCVHESNNMDFKNDTHCHLFPCCFLGCWGPVCSHWHKHVL